MNKFLKSRGLYLLALLPFLVAAMVLPGSLMDGAAREALPPLEGMGLLPLHAFPDVWKAVLLGVMLLGVAYLLFHFTRRYKLLYYPTALPCLLYVLLVAGVVFRAGMDIWLVSTLLLVMALWRLFSGIFISNRNNSLFDFGFLVMLAVIVCPKFALLLLWALFALLFSGRSKAKEILALFIGFVVPLWFLAFYYFWMGNLAALPALFWQGVVSGTHFAGLSALGIVHLALSTLLALVALGQLSLHYSALIVSHRQSFLALISFWGFLVLTFFLIPGVTVAFLYAFFLPLALIYAHYFISNRFAVANNIFFFFLLGICVLAYFI